MVIFVLIFDCIEICSIFIVIYWTFKRGLDRKKEDEEAGERYLQWITRIWFCVSLEVFLLASKIFYGFNWLLKGRTRKAFLPYYYASITFYGGAMSVSFILIQLNFELNRIQDSI